MNSTAGEEYTHWNSQESNSHEEKIFVSVRLRPLNEKELFRNDASDWECINETTILYKNGLPEKALYPSAYTFDKVFGCDSSTKQVYKEGTKRVALSVVSGINSSIFAYGQTSSGKTYTMRGITEFTIADVYDYIHRHPDREFVMKFSAMEIYNESVRDLLSLDGTPLRLLDDPERGTVVERLTEVTLKDWTHLKELLSVCEAQRQIGETSLNELSSRSHQILRLTIESSVRELSGSENPSTLSASVSFVDLAGSERASQTLSGGARLKEGSHINRSLLTLGTVIRKLSKGRNGHVPYRDSKLTRILQNSLGGNARTAIICTMSPAHSHVEQSRNTLLFASCAKEVSTNAQVNVVMSEKILVKQLQRELARLESELRSLASRSAAGQSLNEKELLIQKMEREVRELTQQRDVAQSRVEDLLRSSVEYQVPKPWAEHHHLSEAQQFYEYSASEASEVVDPFRSDVASCTSPTSEKCDRLDSNNKHDSKTSEDCFLSDETSPRMAMNKYFGPDPCQGWEKIDPKTDDQNCKDVQCIETEPKEDRIIKYEAIPTPKKGGGRSDYIYEDLKRKILDMQNTIDLLVNPYPIEQSPFSPATDVSSSKSINFCRSRSCRAVISYPWLEKDEEKENTPPKGYEREFPGRPEGHHLLKLVEEKDGDSGKLDYTDLETPVESVSVEEKGDDTKISKGDFTKTSDGDGVSSLHFYATQPDEADESKPEKALGDDIVKPEKALGDDIDATDAKTSEESEDEIVVKVDDGVEKQAETENEPLVAVVDSASNNNNNDNWELEFERQRKEIIQLWDECKVPLVHRTYFFLLFQGDPSDSIYMEVEHRQLSFLKQSTSHASSLKALNREREILSKQVMKKFTMKERESLYTKWGIRLDTKQRRQQLCRMIWTDTKDMEHVKESAGLVAKLVGFVEPNQAPKEMFGLSFYPKSLSFRSYSWKNTVSYQT